MDADMKITNNEPLTWACCCGQMNLLTDQECLMCGGLKDDTWDEADRKRAVIVFDPRDPEAKERIVGFDVR